MDMSSEIFIVYQSWITCWFSYLIILH